MEYDFEAECVPGTPLLLQNDILPEKGSLSFMKARVILMQLAPILETIMLVCFGFSWPMNLIKAYRSGTAKSTSLPFILLIITGYIAGISAKIALGNINYVLAAYFLNLAIVSLNLVVYFRNVSLDRKVSKA